MSESEILVQLDKRVKEHFSQDVSGHDYYHILRVVGLTKRLHTDENLTYALYIAYLHDVYDDKLTTTNLSLASLLEQWNLDLKVDLEVLMNDLNTIGYKGGFQLESRSAEAKLVSDADMLDAMGAIGIARTFYFSGSKGWPIFDPSLENQQVANLSEYRTKTRNAIDHFDEKLLKLKDLMETETGKKEAIKRHQILLSFYHQFMEEMRDI